MWYLICWPVAHDLISRFVCITCNHELSFEEEKAYFFPIKGNIIMFKWLKKKSRLTWTENSLAAYKPKIVFVWFGFFCLSCFRRACTYTCTCHLHMHREKKKWNFHVNSGINIYCDTLKSTFLLLSGLGTLEVNTENVTCIFLPLMMESELIVKVVILLLSVLVSCTSNTGFFPLISHYFMFTMSASDSRSSNGKVQYKWT